MPHQSMNGGMVLYCVGMTFGIPMFIMSVLRWRRDNKREARARQRRQALRRKNHSSRPPARQNV